MTRFRPCIDLHDGAVKQIVGGTLGGGGLVTNHVSPYPPEWFARRYRDDGLRGGHVIRLGPGNDAAARNALAAWPGGLQVGGGITAANAAEWIEAGASHVIVTSFLFDSAGHFLSDALAALAAAVGRERVVVDLSCRRDGDGWVVAMQRWTRRTQLALDPATLDRLAPWCAEFLIHAADVEGLRSGVDAALVRMLGSWGRLPVTYAGGVRDLDDLYLVEAESGGVLDVTVGSALDLFGGSLPYLDCVAFNQRAGGGRTADG